MSLLGNISTVQGTQTPNIENTQPSADSRTASPIQLGNNSHVVTTETQTTNSVGQGGQTFPTTLNPDATANASTQLNVTTGTTQPQPIQNRTVTAAEQKKDPPKPKLYNFTFKQLDDIAKGKYNMGEIALDRKGMLTKINNHVHATGKNTVVTTPRENTRLRQQVYACIMDKYNLEGFAMTALQTILFGEGRASRSLSRDELGHLLKGISDGRFGSELGAFNVQIELDEIRQFKTGDKNSPDEVSAMKESGLIKGLANLFKNEVVCQVSKNAKFDIAYAVVDNGLTGFNLINGMGSASGLLQSVYQNTAAGKDGGQYTTPPKQVPVDDRLLVYRNDIMDLASREMARLVMENRPTESLRSELAERLLPQVEKFCQQRLERRNPAYANPGKIMQMNRANPEKKMYIRQTFNRCDSGMETKDIGSQFCFLNSVLNAVLASNNQNAKDKLAEMFDENGFRLYDRNGEPKTYSYDDPNLPRSGCYSVYEESLNVHFKQVSDLGQKYNYSAGEPKDAAKVLGMKKIDTVDQQFNFLFGEMTKEDFIAMLNNHLNEGRFVTFFEDGHYVAVNRFELLENGSVKMSVVDDRVGPFGQFAYDRTFTDEQFKTLCQSGGEVFAVLDWSDAAVENIQVVN